VVGEPKTCKTGCTYIYTAQHSSLEISKSPNATLNCGWVDASSLLVGAVEIARVKLRMPDGT
jgi:hypothetical protein